MLETLSNRINTLDKFKDYHDQVKMVKFKIDAKSRAHAKKKVMWTDSNSDIASILAQNYSTVEKLKQEAMASRGLSNSNYISVRENS